MDGAQEVERNRAARAVSAKVHTGARGHVSFGEPAGMIVGNEFNAISRRRVRIVCRGSGQTIVELALVLPLLLLVLVGVTEIGRYAYFDILVSNAARAGAQYGAQSVIHAADEDGIKAAAHSDGLNSMTITPTQQCKCPTGTLATCPGGGVCPQKLIYVQVTATDTYDSLFNYPGLPGQLILSSTVTMRVSQ
jgi:Flp pilus assembly protein TadG